MTKLALTPSKLITIRDNIPKTTSLLVAEAFGKRHKNVIQKLETLDCSKEFNGLNFQPVEYVDAKGESRPMWEMTKDGFMFLVMGFTGKKAAAVKEAYINAFNIMAAQLAEKQGTTEEVFGDKEKYKMVNTLIEHLQFTEKPMLVPHRMIKRLARKTMGMDAAVAAIRDLNEHAMSSVKEIETMTGQGFWEERS